MDFEEKYIFLDGPLAGDLSKEEQKKLVRR